MTLILSWKPFTSFLVSAHLVVIVSSQQKGYKKTNEAVNTLEN